MGGSSICMLSSITSIEQLGLIYYSYVKKETGSILESAIALFFENYFQKI